MDDKYIERTRIASRYSQLMEHDRWIKEIPPLQFDSDWEVTIIPPFSWAVARFWVKKGDNDVSVYLDCYDSLWVFGAPYWELYPDTDDQPARYAMMDTQWLMDNIRRVLNS